MEIEISHTVTHDNQHPPFVLPSMSSSNELHVQRGSSVQNIGVSLDVPSVPHESQQACIQKDNYDYRWINALDLGLTPIDGEETSKLNKLMDVSSNYSFLM